MQYLANCSEMVRLDTFDLEMQAGMCSFACTMEGCRCRPCLEIAVRCIEMTVLHRCMAFHSWLRQVDLAVLDSQFQCMKVAAVHSLHRMEVAAVHSLPRMKVAAVHSLHRLKVAAVHSLHRMKVAAGRSSLNRISRSRSCFVVGRSLRVGS